MIFTNPIQFSPQGQTAKGAVPLITASAPNAAIKHYRLNAGDEAATGTLTTFGSRTLLGSPLTAYEYVLKLGLSGVPADGDVNVEIAVENGSAIAGWRYQAHAENIQGSNTTIAVRERYPLFLIPADRNATVLNIRILVGSGITLEWVVFERILGIVFPSLPVKGQLANVRKATRTLTGKTYTTRQSADPVYNLSTEMKNDPRGELALLFDALDKLRVFGCIPSGIESEFGRASVPYRALDFVRNLEVARYSGITGHTGIDVHGISAKIDLRESSVQRFTAPVQTAALADFFGLTTEAGDPITGEDGAPLLT